MMKPPKTKPKTVPQFLKNLETQNMTTAEWARKHKQPVNTVYMLCLGRLSGARGKAREVAGVMGLTLPPMRASAKRVDGDAS